MSRERDIFLEASEIASNTKRFSFIDAACSGDLILRDRVQSLISAHNEATGFLPEWDITPERKELRGNQPVTEGSGSMVGRYKLLEKIGEGGFGEVYMAEQREPVKRRVALKIIKLGMDTKQVVARFEAERQALAMMEHPNIARVLDGGATEAGRPFFVMELVRGIPITQFCDEHRLTTEERLRLVLPVCEAIQHAHQKGVIHRDIKPNNVLITLHQDRPVPKVIDFGIAKAVDHELTDKTVFTRFHEFLGTPVYMSPEQAKFNGLDIDTRSDIYSLGVLLYELLAGSAPFDAAGLKNVGFDEIRRRIREQEAPKPSTKFLSSPSNARTRIASLRKTDPLRLHRSLKGELDWIVMKAIEKDRSRRYESATAFAGDIERYLNREPVKAAAPGVCYRVRKFAQRHRTGLAVAAVIGAVLVISTLVSGWLAVRAKQAERTARRLLETEQHSRAQLQRFLIDLKLARRTAEEENARAREEAATAEAVARFVSEDLFGAIDPAREPDPGVTVRTVMDRASRRLQAESQFKDQPLVAASLHTIVGRSYRNLGLYAEGAEHLRKAYELLHRNCGAPDEATLRSMILYAQALDSVNQRHEAIPLIKKAREEVRETLGTDHPLYNKATVQLAWMHYRQKERAEAFSLAEEAYAKGEDYSKIDEADLFGAMHLLARHRATDGTGSIEESDRLLQRVVQLSRERRGEDHPQTLRAKNNLAVFYFDWRKKLDEAERLYLEVLQVQRRIPGLGHDHTLITTENLALIYEVLGRPRDALAHYLSVLRFRPLSAHALGLMPRFFDEVSLTPLIPIQADGWRMTINAPAENWMQLHFDATNWTESVQPDASEGWLRYEFDLNEVPDQPLVFWINAWGNFEVAINGIRAVETFGSAGKQFQLAVCNVAGHNALRRGRNVLSIHATKLRPPSRLNIAVYHFPD